MSRRKPLSPQKRADRALCPVAVANILGLRVAVVAELMRSAEVVEPLTVQNAKVWSKSPSKAPGWLRFSLEGRKGPQEPSRSAPPVSDQERKENEFAEAWLRAFKDEGDTDCWAAGVLHQAGVHTIDLGDGRVVPVLPPDLRVVE